MHRHLKRSKDWLVVEGNIKRSKDWLVVQGNIIKASEIATRCRVTGRVVVALRPFRTVSEGTKQKKDEIKNSYQRVGRAARRETMFLVTNYIPPTPTPHHPCPPCYVYNYKRLQFAQGTISVEMWQGRVVLCGGGGRVGSRSTKDDGLFSSGLSKETENSFSAPTLPHPVLLPQSVRISFVIACPLRRPQAYPYISCEYHSWNSLSVFLLMATYNLSGIVALGTPLVSGDAKVTLQIAKEIRERLLASVYYARRRRPSLFTIVVSGASAFARNTADRPSLKFGHETPISKTINTSVCVLSANCSNVRSSRCKTTCVVTSLFIILPFVSF
ncbi:hypothetical protein J6590_015735 [Homalodisca vitripennis]|nr:hypothetical protein J6590_015735 [Homalodisca vitripennis]